MLWLPYFFTLAIRVAARWYQSHLGESTQILLVTNDRENKKRATEEGISAETGNPSYNLSVSKLW